MIDLKTYEYPEVSESGRIFSTEKIPSDLFEEAKRRGFYNGHTPYNRLFSQLFFNGGNLLFKKDLDDNLKSKAWPYCRTIMASLEPKHEVKEAVCAMLMSEILEIAD